MNNIFSFLVIKHVFTLKDVFLVLRRTKIQNHNPILFWNIHTA